MSEFSKAFPNSKKVLVDGPQGVRVPMREIALSSTPCLKFTRSNTVYALGFVRLQFEYGCDYQTVRQQTINRLKDVNVPPGVTPVISPAGGISARRFSICMCRMKRSGSRRPASKCATRPDASRIRGPSATTSGPAPKDSTGPNSRSRRPRRSGCERRHRAPTVPASTAASTWSAAGTLGTPTRPACA